MSFAALLTDRAHVYARSAGQDHWYRVTREPVACRVVELSPGDVELGLDGLRSEITHRGRCLPHPQVRAGRKLVLVAGCAVEGGGQPEVAKQPRDGRAFIVVALRRVSHPAPHGHLALSLRSFPGDE